MLIAKNLAKESGVTLENVKDHLRIDHDADDNLLQTLLNSAIRYVENLSGWSLTVTDYEWTIEPGDLRRAIPLYPAEITSGQAINDGYVVADIGDTVTFTTKISHYCDALLPAVLLQVQSLYEAQADEQERLDRAVRAICSTVRRNLGV